MLSVVWSIELIRNPPGARCRSVFADFVLGERGSAGDEESGQVGIEGSRDMRRNTAFFFCGAAQPTYPFWRSRIQVECRTGESFNHSVRDFRVEVKERVAVPVGIKFPVAVSLFANIGP